MFVKQRSNYDCALAVLSMASGKNYEDLFSQEFQQRIEKATTCTGDDLVEAYRLAGFEKDKNMWVIYVGHNISPPLFRQLIRGRRAAIQVPSLNYEGSEHFIYWDGYKLFDPSNKQTYDYIQSVFPTYVTIFDEVAPTLQESEWEQKPVVATVVGQPDMHSYMLDTVFPVGTKLYIGPSTSTTIAAMAIKQAAEIVACWPPSAEVLRNIRDRMVAEILALSPTAAEAELEMLNRDANRYKWIRDKSKDHSAPSPAASLLPGAGLKVVYQHYGMAHNRPSIYVDGEMLDNYVDQFIKTDAE